MGRHAAFSLVGSLCALTVLAVLIANLGWFGANPEGPFAKWGMAAVLAEIIGLFVWIVRSSPPPLQLQLTLVLPRRYEALDLDSLRWRDEESWLVIADEMREPERARVRPVKARAGNAFQVSVPAKITERLTGRQTLALRLTDDSGVRWEVPAFNPFDNRIEFAPAKEESNHRLFLQSYQDEEQ